MKAVVISTEEVVNRIIDTSFGDIQTKKSLSESISALSSDEEDDDELVNDPRYAECKAAIIQENSKKLEELRKRAGNSDGLLPILVLVGNVSMIRKDVLKPAFEIAQDDPHYGFDIEVQEIDANQLTRKFVESIGKPNGKDGGVLVVNGLTRFIEMYDVNDQSGLIRNIMVNPKGGISTGWRVIFVEESESEKIYLSNSFVENWTKGNIYFYYIADSK
jgi:hypothetical protein